MVMLPAPTSPVLLTALVEVAFWAMLSLLGRAVWTLMSALQGSIVAILPPFVTIVGVDTIVPVLMDFRGMALMEPEGRVAPILMNALWQMRVGFRFATNRLSAQIWRVIIIASVIAGSREEVKPPLMVQSHFATM